MVGALRAPGARVNRRWRRSCRGLRGHRLRLWAVSGRITGIPDSWLEREGQAGPLAVDRRMNGNPVTRTADLSQGLQWMGFHEASEPSQVTATVKTRADIPDLSHIRVNAVRLCPTHLTALVDDELWCPRGHVVGLWFVKSGGHVQFDAEAFGIDLPRPDGRPPHPHAKVAA